MKYTNNVKIRATTTKTLFQSFQTLTLLITFILFVLIGAVVVRENRPVSIKPAADTSPTIYISSPQPGSQHSGTITLVAGVSNMPASSYDMFWYVDNGRWNWMGNSSTNDSTKQADISLTSWTWHAPSTAYTITLVAITHSGGQRVYSGLPITVTQQVEQTRVSSPASASSPTPLAEADTLYVNPNSNASQTAASTSDPTMKRIMSRLASIPTASWFGNWNSNIQADVGSLVTAASTRQQTPVLVAYNIPNRDCSGYSAGGASSADTYESWIKEFANGIGSKPAIVILEPDALAQIKCLSSSELTTRYQLLSFALATLKVSPNTKVYMDAGNPTWVAASDMATRLQDAGIDKADGFSLNVSNFIGTTDNVTYGQQLSALVHGKHFVIDTSRNGKGSDGEWCNPAGRALGNAPTNQTGNSSVDYYLWVKAPGESDGTCNGGPAAGVWWPSYAESLALNAGW